MVEGGEEEPADRADPHPDEEEHDDEDHAPPLVASDLAVHVPNPTASEVFRLRGIWRGEDHDTASSAVRPQSVSTLSSLLFTLPRFFRTASRDRGCDAPRSKVRSLRMLPAMNGRAPSTPRGAPRMTRTMLARPTMAQSSSPASTGTCSTGASAASHQAAHPEAARQGREVPSDRQRGVPPPVRQGDHRHGRAFNDKLTEWEVFYNYARPHGALGWADLLRTALEKDPDIDVTGSMSVSQGAGE